VLVPAQLSQRVIVAFWVQIHHADEVMAILQIELLYQTLPNPPRDNLKPQPIDRMPPERAMKARPLSRQGRGGTNANGRYPIWRTRADYLLPPNKPTSLLFSFEQCR